MKTLLKADLLLVLPILIVCLTACTVTEGPSLTPASITAEPKEVFLERLNDSLCRLPCWIGITPSVSSIDEAHAFFRRLGVDEIESPYSNETLHHYSYELAYITFRSNENRITDINVEIVLNSLSDVLDDFLRFSAENVIKSYGAPDELVVILVRNMEPLAQQPYAILLFYTGQNFIVIEEGVLQDKAADFRCFEDHIAQRLYIITGSRENIFAAQDFWYSELESPSYALDYLDLNQEDVNLLQGMQQAICD